MLRWNSAHFECCSCRTSRHDPVLLDCLHNYCQSCIHKKSEKQHTFKSIVKCCVCSYVTEISENVTKNSFLLWSKQVAALFSESVQCSTCKTELMADFWCADCCNGLCASCYSLHNHFKSHHRSAELEVARNWSLSQLTPKTITCIFHNQHIEAHCFICCEPKCLQCCKVCKAMGHDMRPLLHIKTRQHLNRVMEAAITAMERLRHLLPGVLKKCQGITLRLPAVCDSGKRTLRNHRNRLLMSTVNAFDKSVGQVSVNLHRILLQCPDSRMKEVSESCIAKIGVISLDAFQSLQLLGVMKLLKKTAADCAYSNVASVRKLLKSWGENESISINGSAPVTADVVLSACLKTAYRCPAAPSAPLLFGQGCVTFPTSVDCWDLAVTPDGHVLLAANEHGLLVYNDRGVQLNSWKPRKQSNGKDDWVSSVSAVSDGRAVVGVVYSQCVMLLRSNDTGDTWQEDRRVAVMQSPLWQLAVYDDLLAAVELKRYEAAGSIQDELQRHKWTWGRQVTLLRLSSGLRLYKHSRQYDIGSVALTALSLVTTSFGRVKRNSGIKPFVIEGFSHSEEYLWRIETSNEDAVWGLCTSCETWSRVYVTLRRGNVSSSRVLAIGGADGLDLREVMNSETHGLQLPGYLSLARGRKRTVLAVLSYDEAAREYRTVTLYEAAIGDE